ncbi:B mating type pheromone precursor [Gelatoporia subvermispora B]|uniref:B mating type pheromone n=1 Tax=Ceriporiopsis subvermispora (strain B) TaxID=914234 RepID=M2PGS0_CERS8|nr:B mating type pheromone precursor [Gelatoporia subvermispora B]
MDAFFTIADVEPTTTGADSPLVNEETQTNSFVSQHCIIA